MELTARTSLPRQHLGQVRNQIRDRAGMSPLLGSAPMASYVRRLTMRSRLKTALVNEGRVICLRHSAHAML